MALPGSRTVMPRSRASRGEGTSVRLYLPRHQGGAPARPAPIAVSAEHVATGETVLVVEDQPVVRAVIMEMLEEQGYRTLEAVDGAAGLRILQGDEKIDLLVTDVGLPGINGRQLADQAGRPVPASRCFSSPATPKALRSTVSPATRHGNDHQAIRSRQFVASGPRTPLPPPSCATTLNCAAGFPKRW